MARKKKNTAVIETKNVSLPFGKNVQNILDDFQITQSDFAKKLGVCQTDISSWVKGRGAPSLFMLYRVKDTLGVSFDDLLNDHGTETDEEVQNSQTYKNYKKFYQDIFPDEFVYSMPEDYENVCNRILEDAFDERTRQILIHRYGLDGTAPESFVSVSEKFDVSRQRIDQIVKRSLATLRSYRRYFLPVSTENIEQKNIDKDLRLQYYAVIQDTLEDLQQKLDIILNVDDTYEPEEEIQYRTAMDELDDIPLEYANIAPRGYKALKKLVGVNSIGGMLKITEKELRSIRGLGDKTMDIITDKQAEIRQNPAEWLKQLKVSEDINYIDREDDGE